jgi:enamine deaminase RidA (YjgF/YER057c/UK114 family)
VAADVMVVPTRRLIHVSGQAEPGDLRESIRKTLESLSRTVTWVDNRGTIAQIKVFMTSLENAHIVCEEAVNSGLFSERQLPAISFVQWTNTGPTEIEVIASAWGPEKDAQAHERLEFLTPPGMTESPVYSKVAVTRSNRLIFTSGLYGTPNGTGEAQVTSLFSELEQVAKGAGSDLRHLAKATYYITNDEVGSRLNALRPKYYDPKRPPAASKATVKGVGVEGCTITLDVIAVPAGK